MREPPSDARLFWSSGGFVYRRAFAEPPPGAALGSPIYAEPLTYATAQALFLASVTAKGALADRVCRDLARAIEETREMRRCAGWADPHGVDEQARHIAARLGDD